MIDNLDNTWYKYYNLLIFDEIDSTNEEAKRLYKSGIRENFVIWAKSQNNGKGRHTRNWISPEGNLYLSILIKPNYTVKDAAMLSFLTAVSLGEVIENHLTISNSILEYKWPNDLMLDKKKFGGILLESGIKSDSDNIEWLVIGIGINILSYPEENVIYPATSLLHENIYITCEKLVDEFMKNFTRNYSTQEAEGFEYIRKKWLLKAMNFQKVITINSGKSKISGVFKNLTNEGNLELTLESGETCQICTGEVFYK